MKFVKQDLYGGAISTTIPIGLLDASTIRQIPDTQEVFLNPSTNSSDVSQLFKDDTIIVELLEMIEKSDKESILEHLSELSNLNSVGENEWRVVKYTKVELNNFKEDSAYVVTCIEPSKKWGKVDNGASLVLILGIIRIKKVKTDLLVTLNSPVNTAQFGDEIVNLENGSLDLNSALGQKVAFGESVITEMLNNLTVKEWGLFA